MNKNQSIESQEVKDQKEGCKTQSSNQGRKNNRYYTKKKSKSNGNKLKSRSNDVSWYSASTQLLADAASIPFSWATGSPIDMNIPGIEAPTTIPGIMTMDLWPSYGVMQDATSPINMAATKMYSFIRHANSGSKNYDAPDLMLYIMSMSELYSAINWAMRAYGVCSLYATKNRYFPKALLQAMGISYEGLIDNLASFRYGINLIISKAASLVVPGDMPIFRRRAFAFQNLYIESSNVKDQVYFFNPKAFFKFNFDVDGGFLEPEILPESQLSWKDILNILNNMLDRLLLNEDINIMSGDILKAYGDNVIKVSYMPETYSVVPVYDVTVLEQFKNATVFDYQNLILDNIRQDAIKRNLVCNNYWHPVSDRSSGVTEANQRTFEQPVYKGYRVLSTNGTGTPAEVMENTRLMVALNKTGIEEEPGTQKMKFKLISGTDIACGLQIWTYDFTGQGQAILSHTNYMYAYAPDSAVSKMNGIHSLCDIKQFYYAPAAHIVFLEESYQYRMLCYDWNNFAIIDNNLLYKLHETALMSLFNVSSVGMA